MEAKKVPVEEQEQSPDIIDQIRERLDAGIKKEETLASIAGQSSMTGLAAELGGILLDLREDLHMLMRAGITPYESLYSMVPVEQAAEREGPAKTNLNF